MNTSFLESPHPKNGLDAIIEYNTNYIFINATCLDNKEADANDFIIHKFQLNINVFVRN